MHRCLTRVRTTCRDLRKHLFGRFKRKGATDRGAPQPTEGRGRRRSRSPEPARETSEERRARIQEWSRKRKQEAAAA